MGDIIGSTGEPQVIVRKITIADVEGDGQCEPRSKTDGSRLEDHESDGDETLTEEIHSTFIDGSSEDSVEENRGHALPSGPECPVSLTLSN